MRQSKMLHPSPHPLIYISPSLWCVGRVSTRGCGGLRRRRPWGVRPRVRGEAYTTRSGKKGRGRGARNVCVHCGAGVVHRRARCVALYLRGFGGLAALIADPHC